MSGRHRRWVCRECGRGLGGHAEDCKIGGIVAAHKRLFCPHCGFALPLHKNGCGAAKRGEQDMSLTGGGAKPVDPHDGEDEPLTIHPDAPCPSSIENTHTEQALRDAQAIDQAYER